MSAIIPCILDTKTLDVRLLLDDWRFTRENDDLSRDCRDFEYPQTHTCRENSRIVTLVDPGDETGGSDVQDETSLVATPEGPNVKPESLRAEGVVEGIAEKKKNGLRDANEWTDIEGLWRGRVDVVEVRFQRNMHADALAAFRWAVCGLLRLLFTGHLGPFAQSVSERLSVAERLCRASADKLAAQIVLPRTEVSFLKLPRGSRNPGALPPGFKEGTPRDWELLREWRSVMGAGAMCAWLAAQVHAVIGPHNRRHLAMQRARTMVSRAMAYPDAAESPVPNCLLYLTFCLLDAPPMPHSLSEGLGGRPRAFRAAAASSVEDSREQTRRRLRELLKVSREATEEETETLHLGRLALVYMDMDQIDHLPWDSHTSLAVKACESLVCEVLAKQPEYVLYRWALSHIQRRLGDVASAISTAESLRAFLDEHMFCAEVAPLVDTAPLPSPFRRRLSFFGRGGEYTASEEPLAVHPPVATSPEKRRVRFSQQRYALTYDIALCHFMNRGWSACELLLCPLLETGAQFRGRVSCFALLAACLGVRGDVPAAVFWLERLLVAARKEPVEDKTDVAWALRAPALLMRPHKELLAYEAAYFLGSMAWAETSPPCETPWLQSARTELTRIDSEVTVSIVFPDELASAESVAEELLTVVFLRAAIFAAIGDYANAEALFRAVIVNARTERMRTATLADPWHTAFAQYELAWIELRNGRVFAAEAFLRQAHLATQRNKFSFSGLLTERLIRTRAYIDRVVPIRLAVALS